MLDSIPKNIPLFSISMQKCEVGARFSAFNDTHKENLIQYKNLLKKILAASDLFDVFTQSIKVYGISSSKRL